MCEWTNGKKKKKKSPDVQELCEKKDVFGGIFLMRKETFTPTERRKSSSSLPTAHFSPAVVKGALEERGIERERETERGRKKSGGGGEMSASARWVPATSGTVYHLVQTGNQRLIREHRANLRSARAGLWRSLGLMTAVVF